MKFVPRCLCAMLLALATAGGTALAQQYPTRAIRLLVPFPPGGPADILARIIAQRMSEGFGQQVIVDNRPGANTIIAAEMGAKAAPDGYTILMAIDSTLTMNPAMYTKLPYDPIKDFAPVSLIAIVPAVLVAHPSFPASNIGELIALAKSRPPGSLNFGTGILTMHVGGELLGSMAGIKMTPVFYKGGNTSSIAVIAGEIPLSFEGAATVLPHWRQGKVKILGVMGAKRLATAPEIPSISETLPGYDVSVWQSIVVPAGTPRDVVLKLNSELSRIMKLPDTRERLAATGIEPTAGTPEDLAAHIRSETAKWGKVIRDIGLKVE
ncbi:MAG: tripartite tricarboxylate transporter substrate binding protein [Betaproteobacteria bacterium]|nr:tripartite tricarboxylate transporter substrate binding protein [Betaproteobacteria bacterium]